MELAVELEAFLKDLAAHGAIEILENNRRIGSFSDLSWEVRGASKSPLIHIWSESYNLTRRVLAIADHSQQHLALSVERFGRSKPGRLEIIRLEYEPSTRDLSRQSFCERLRRLLASQFPDESVDSLTVSPDLEHSLSGNYARGLLRRASSRIAVLGVPEGESADNVVNSLTFALLWLDRGRHSGRRGNVAALRLILPKNTCQSLVARVRALNPRLQLEIYARDPVLETLEHLDLRQTGNVDTWLVPHREAEALLERSRSTLEPILALAPSAITLHPVPQSREVWLRFRGLSFARWEDARVFFGIAPGSEELTPATWPTLKRLLRDLELHRHPLATDTRHSLYRAQAERWLESLVREDVTRIDPALDPRFVYSQVFANAAGEHGILDLLCVTRLGRIAILELKASEHIHLPLQAAEYWLRIRQHLEQGDFARYGYFLGIELQAAPPLVYLVAPALHFHPSTDALLRFLSPEMEVLRVGLAENWRQGLRVVMRQ